jgi:hypothetical protein
MENLREKFFIALGSHGMDENTKVPVVPKTPFFKMTKKVQSNSTYTTCTTYSTEPVFVNLLMSPGIDYQPEGTDSLVP